MKYSFTMMALWVATSVNALPLNINLGAYSPALVVGDGEISFGGEADVSNLITALSGASQGAEAAAATTSGTAATTSQKANVAEAEVVPVVTTPEVAVPETVPVASTNSLQSGIGMGNDIVRPRDDQEADEAEGRNIEPREPEKRDLAGFNAALNYAANALKTSPEVELGTGEGGSGVGITVHPGSQSGAAAKRDVGNSLPTVTMLKIRTLSSETKNSKRGILKVRSVDPSPRAVEGAQIAPAPEGDDIDQVNLNLGDGQDYELTITEVKP